MSRVFAVLFMAFALMGFVACGGGDSTGGTEDNAVTPDNGPGGDEGQTDTPPVGDEGQKENPPVGDEGQKENPPVGDEGQQENPPVGDEGQENPPVGDTAEQTCTPDCAGKTCGDNGCGGKCGDLNGACPDGEYCDGTQNCVPGTCSLPTSWGPTGAIITAEIAANATGCPNGHNDLGLVASMANPELKKAIEEGKFGILLEFQGVSDFGNTASFTLAGLLGEPETLGSTSYLLDPEAYKQDDCQPLISFADASISGGLLAAGPSEFYLNLPIEELGGILELTLKKATIAASITDGTVAATDGVIGGYALKEDLDPIFENLKSQCPDPNKSFCDYVSYFSMIDMLYKNYDIDGEQKKALAACLKFTLGGATVKGYKP
ncbi:MAG: hypothetical protein FJ087_01930 [Deltaproteobacteria bacterium]|nr:hypothetical protein [Deltaproteobacteria bacterium]